ncbi:LLM class flavin-dependent oxidoreductase [Bordetella sp. N]|uniref:LLM class flavin-dependent oxidoreductase n=1 Tax=Bordetella sp. N TaxID=1746199 RepID=UPI00070C561C|nr:LLM class flavin-dependent oxidoreductase [Bordetella sp. N]ALM82265.1 nitrilotriacetate monooxygenase [Bordetella sp. N]
MSDRGHIKLGAFLHATGHHVAGWRAPAAQADAGVNLRHYLDMAVDAERAGYDMIFLADTLMVKPGSLDTMSRIARYTALFEPLTLLSALAVVTRNIGLVATATTTYNEPFHVARKFASLDLISGGRAGWNLVTSANPAEAGNFGGHAHPLHAERYERAREFHKVVLGLWNSWEDDAFSYDKESGQYFDPAKLHALEHEGKHFQVRGPLNAARSPQGHPIVVQAGSSPAGRALAAETAEVVFTAETDLERARAFYADVKGRMPAFGRDPEHLKIMPGVYAVVGRSEAEAREKNDQLQRLIEPAVGLSILGEMLGTDLSGHPIDGPLPDIPTTNGGKGRQEVVLALARRENLSIRQLYTAIAGARGHLTVCGTASQVADVLETWFKTEAADGFNVMPPSLPDGLTDFSELVIPELRRRGLFRERYEGSTLRENLGLPIPTFKR